MNDRQPLKILHLTAGSDAGGISRYLLYLCCAMHEAGHDVTIAGEHGAWHHEFANVPWKWIDVPLHGGLVSLFHSWRTLRKFLAGHPVDVIHAHYRKSAIVGRKLSRATQTPLLYTLHLSHIPMNGFWGHFTDFGDHTHVAASEARDWLMEDCHVPAARISLISHGIEAARFPVVTDESRAIARKDLGLDPSDTIALYVGRLDHPKNEDWLLDLALESKTKLPRLKILLAGDGPNEPHLRERIKTEHLSDRVFLLGHRDPLPLYHAADALLLPSEREGFSYVCVEAMCAGIPVLRTRTSGTREMIVETVTGQSVAIERRAFISGAIDFLKNKDRLAAMGNAAARHVRTYFTFDQQVEQTVALYRMLAALKRR